MNNKIDGGTLAFVAIVTIIVMYAGVLILIFVVSPETIYDGDNLHVTETVYDGADLQRFVWIAVGFCMFVATALCGASLIREKSRKKNNMGANPRKCSRD